MEQHRKRTQCVWSANYFWSPACQFDEQPPVVEEYALGYNPQVRMEKRQLDCWVLVRTGSVPLPLTKGGAMRLGEYTDAHRQITLHSLPLSALVLALNQQPPGALQHPLIVDETGCTLPVDLVLNAPPHDLQALRTELQAYGLDLQPATREIEAPAFMTTNRAKSCPNEQPGSHSSLT